jgi:hypothetical protein
LAERGSSASAARHARGAERRREVRLRELQIRREHRKLPTTHAAL